LDSPTTVVGSVTGLSASHERQTALIESEPGLVARSGGCPRYRAIHTYYTTNQGDSNNVLMDAAGSCGAKWLWIRFRPGYLEIVSAGWRCTTRSYHGTHKVGVPLEAGQGFVIVACASAGQSAFASPFKFDVSVSRNLDGHLTEILDRIRRKEKKIVPEFPTRRDTAGQWLHKDIKPGSQAFAPDLQSV